ncbi:MAG TPA: hypothetical protein HPP58_06485 [Deltaproteobacteria bacterium]|nr:hypothetical protein [Deltaproteobacteria bacterium]
MSGLPTLLFTVSSVIEDITKCVTMDPKFPGDPIYVLGLTKNELGGGEYYQMMESTGLHVPQVDAKAFRPRYLRLHEAIKEGLLSSCHAVSRGGLAVHLALTAMGGELGMDIDLDRIPAGPGLTAAQILYSETCGRFIITVSPQNRERFEEMFHSMDLEQVGMVTDSRQFTITHGKAETIIGKNIQDLKKAWKKPFGDLI